MKLSFEQLDVLQGDLAARLFRGDVGLREYVVEWDELVTFAGWTWDEVAAEVDRRWDGPGAPPADHRWTVN